jgi:hypothetical protein
VLLETEGRGINAHHSRSFHTRQQAS